MKSVVKSIALLTIVGSLAGCATNGLLSVAPPSESSLDAVPFQISVPKGVENTSQTINGIQLGSFQNRSGEIDFFAVQFSNTTSSDELVTSVCKGHMYASGNRAQSCIYFDARIAVQNAGENYELTITPYRVRSIQGRNAVALPIPLPEIDINSWYRWMSNQSVGLTYKMTSEFGPESIKGNFDRLLGRYTWRPGEVDAALRRFKDTYVMDLGGGMQAHIGAAFFPYRDGSLVELYIRGEGSTQNGVVSRDWVTAIARVKAELDRIVNQ